MARLMMRALLDRITFISDMSERTTRTMVSKGLVFLLDGSEGISSSSSSSSSSSKAGKDCSETPAAKLTEEAWIEDRSAFEVTCLMGLSDDENVLRRDEAPDPSLVDFVSVPFVSVTSGSLEVHFFVPGHRMKETNPNKSVKRCSC